MSVHGSTEDRQEKSTRQVSFFRARWQREYGPRNRSKRFNTLNDARRFVTLLWGDSRGYGELLWTVIERAEGTIGPWERVDS